MARPSPATRLPAVAHVGRAPGHDQVVLRPEVHVARAQDEAAVPDRGQVDEPLRAHETRHVDRHLSVHAEPGHPSVGVDAQADVGPGPIALDGKQVLRTAPELGRRQEAGPFGPRPNERRRGGPARAMEALEGALLGEVADEVVGVHVHSADDPRHPELDHAPVVAGAAPAPGLPAVHPLAAGGELVGDEDTASRLQEVLLRGEELVVRGHCPAAHAGGGEVRELSEGVHVPAAGPLLGRWRENRPYRKPRRPAGAWSRRRLGGAGPDKG